MTYLHNLLGQLTKKKDALGFEITRAYDENGNLIAENDANGNLKQFVYDDLGQLLRKTLPDNTIEFDYDARGHVISAKNNVSEVVYNYNIDRVMSVRSHGIGSMSGLPDTTLGFTYDENQNRKTMTDPSGTTTYTYDNADRLVHLQNPKGEGFSFTFDQINRMNSMSRPGSVSTFAFDDRNFVTSIIHNRGATTVASVSYVMDNIGNKTNMTTLAGAFNYTYDNDNQLVTASSPETLAQTNPVRQPAAFDQESFNYDAIFNRANDQGGSYTYDNKSQRLLEDYRNIYTYDNNGNLISKQSKGLSGEVTNFEYTSENQLKHFKVFDPAYSNTNPQKEVTYVYDVLGRRIVKQVIHNQDPSKSFERRYVYDGEEIILEYDSTNTILARYTHSSLRTDDVLSADIRSAGVTVGLAQSAGSYQYLKDAQGTVTDISDNSGNKLQHYVYSSFGVILGVEDSAGINITSNPVVKTSYTFTGREYDVESGMYYNRARYYDSFMGRFIQKDPHPGDLSSPAGLVNSYNYTYNAPTMFTDPSGKFGILVKIMAIVNPGTLLAHFGTISALDRGDIKVALLNAAIQTAFTAATAGAGSIAGSLASAGGAIASTDAGALAGAAVGAGFNAAIGRSIAMGAIFGALNGGIAGYSAYKQSDTGIMDNAWKNRTEVGRNRYELGWDSPGHTTAMTNGPGIFRVSATGCNEFGNLVGSSIEAGGSLSFNPMISSASPILGGIAQWISGGACSAFFE